jgi:hypothetical protein
VEPCVIVFEKKAYVVAWEPTTATGMTDLSAPVNKSVMNWVAYELEIAY